MSSNAVFKKSLLAVAVAMGVSAFSTGSFAACPADAPADAVCTTATPPPSGNYTNNDDIYVENGNGITYSASSTFGHLYNRGNISVSGTGSYGIYIASDATMGNINLEQGTSVVSQDDTAIKIDGSFAHTNEDNNNYGVYLKDGGTISGKENAIDFENAKTAVRIDVNGTIQGNIIGNGDSGNKINFAYQGAVS